MFSVITTNQEQTWHIGEMLGTRLSAGDIVCLYGDLGAGKTSFSYGIAIGLEVDDRYITSPTFTFVNEYQGRVPLYHIDLYRLKDPEVYKQWYSTHKTPELLKEAVYGLPELYRESIRTARLVANPGCYPTSIILAAAPLLLRGLIDPETIIADSKSGVSGAGRGASLDVHFCEVNEGFKAYKVAEHRHTPEIEQELSILAGRPVRINFTPHLIPTSRGILSTVYSNLKPGVVDADVEKAFQDIYRYELFVRIASGDSLPVSLQVRGSNYCDIGWRVDKRTRRLIVVSVIDNLTRGASGQAVCNMNIMCGFPEDTGLNQAPWQP